MKYQTPSFVEKKGVVLSKDDVPYDSALVFNAGVNRYQDGYVMLFRNDYGFCRKDFDDFYAGISDNTTPKTNIGAAYSKDGISWKVENEHVFELADDTISRAYDPRMTQLEDGSFGVCFAIDSRVGVRGGIATTTDMKNFDIKSISVPDNRNMVLFPEKINGLYYRLERPFITGSPRFSVWMSSSPDLIHWGNSRVVLESKSVPFANSKIGPAAPPVKTPQGWLTLFHAVEEQEENFDSWCRHWKKCYYGGIMLLDLEDPSKIIALAGRPLLVPEEEYELSGFRGGVIFPGGFIAEPDGTAKIYYGAADTVECLAVAEIKDLIDFCFEYNILEK